MKRAVSMRTATAPLAAVLTAAALMAAGGCRSQSANEHRAAPGTVRVATCNLRGALIEDGEDSWEKRGPVCLETLHKLSADIYCFQEMQLPNRDAIEAAFPDYRFFAALGRPRGGHPMNGMMYRKDRFREEGAGTYALSAHPHLIGSTDWDHDCPRLANYLILRELATGKVFRIVSTHLDHISQPAREKGMAMIIEEGATYPEEMPQILTGDMNCAVDNPALQQLLHAGWLDTFREATGESEPGFTYHAFKGPEYRGRLTGKIDFIFVRGAWKIDAAGIDRERGSSGRFPSDHYFVTADLTLK